jgi:TolB-like protein/Tfp pilus assembly protein PilF/class 3 adenylate cyclase
MSSASSSDVKFEIGHVLFIDLVGYSKLLINEQSEQMQKLREIVRGTEQFRIAEGEGKLVRLPTGDGGALVFRTSSEAPVLCALEISKELKKHPELRVRMGIHSGPVNEITDLNEQANIAGAGINIAQRVMDCGDAGHILLSRHVAEDLEHYPHWRSHLHDLGECEVKHGVRVGVVNLSGDGLGNAAAPKKFETMKKHRAHARWAGLMTVLLIVAVIVAAFFFLLRRPMRSALAIPEKSIAVLPFDNLSRDPDNAYFCEGVQDEILTRLAKVADLKVISRTSTQRFKSTPANLPQIAKQLGVMNIVEGSAQKAGDKVRVNVQLINAMTDAHLWGETYDRKLTDIFAVESEIAKTIADTLQARLSGSEKSSIEKVPTSNSEAYELYLKGRFFWNKRTGEDLRKSIDYLNQAIAKDPNYALAYAGLADSYLLLPTYADTPPADAIPQAQGAAKKALELDDSLAEAHASLGLLAAFEFDPERAISELERAIQLKPNYATAHHWLALTLMALARFDRATAEGKRAIELDPLSLIINADLSWVYLSARRYDDAEAQARKTLEMDSRFFRAHYRLGAALQLKGHIAEAILEYQKAIELNKNPYSIAALGQAYARNGQVDEARKVLARLNEEAKSRYVPPYGLALIHLALGDKEHALDDLERGYREASGSDMFFIKVDPLLDDLHGDPRFETLAQEITRGK